MKLCSLNAINQDDFGLVGGKAKGLFLLSECGLNIASGFVATQIDSEISIQSAADHYAASGLSKVAVRSSASAEDGADFSSAGQYDTVLNVTGKSAVKKAIKQCVASLHNVTAQSYSGFFSDAKSDKMSVIVQEMIDADISGVCFTQHEGDDNIAHIEAVEGLGEKLVSGQVTAHTYIVPKSAFIADGDDLLSSDMLGKIAREASNASQQLGYPLDTEWAISDSVLYWLQARPITVSETIDAFELDTQYMPDDNILTKCNVGEMLPGAVTPLSLSTSVYSIDFGIRKMIKYAGAIKDYSELPQGGGIASVGNTLFINITSAQRIIDHIYGSNRDGVAISICGRILEDVPEQPMPKVNPLIRVNNTRKYFTMLLGAKKACKKLGKLADNFWIEQKQDASAQYDEIEQNLPLMDEGFWLHYISSAHSGAMSSALFFILLDEGMSAESANTTIAGVLEDIEGIESVDILRSLRGVAKALVQENPQAQDYTAGELAEYIKVCEGDSAYALEHFMKRHGHRAIREAEMRSKSWHMDEVALCSFLKSIIASGGKETAKTKMSDQNIEALLSSRKGALKQIIKYLVGQARKGVVNREFTKSKSIKVLDRFKSAYHHLAKLLVAENLLPDEDAVFFLTHDELGSLINDGESSLVKKAIARRRVLEEQKQMKFDEICIGKPKPVTPDFSNMEGASVLLGSSISRGKAVGKARVVTCVSDADELQKGEIMVAAFTDIGWSPYYSMIGALVTEVGSSLSHGAVVAREYALPLVAGIPFATQRIKTGDMLSVDGTTGEVAIIG